MQVIAYEVLLLSQVFGGLPLKYTDETRSGRLITFSPMACVWAWIMIILLIFFSQMTLYVDFQGQLSGNIRMSSYTATFAVVLDVVSLNIMALVVVVESFRHHKKFIEMCYLLGKVDHSLRYQLGYGDQTKVLLVLSYMISLSVASLVQEFYFEYEGRNSFVFYIPVFSLYCVEAALFVQFTTMTQGIAARFRLINDVIKKTVISKSFGQLFRNQSFVKISAIQDDNSCLSNLRELIDLYWLLCDAVQYANVFYGNQLLTTVFSGFAHIIITFYYLFLHLVPGQGSYLVIQGFWAITHISHLVLLVRPSTALTDAANETAPIVCRLINRDLNSNVKKQLKEFLLQLIHHNAALSARGVFPIHSHILTSVSTESLVLHSLCLELVDTNINILVSLGFSKIAIYKATKQKQNPI
ncbi:gustatory receptor [Homalodisca vitripennis]|nr:gustatory receptor [Homalodisca vitripennis]